MKKIILLLAVMFCSELIIAQDYGKISIRNKDNSYPKFVASLNGVRVSNTPHSQVVFEYLDDKSYKIKVLQEGNPHPIIFNVGNTVKFQSKYVLNKDEYGNYTIASEGKDLFMISDPTMTNVTTNNVSFNTAVVPAKTPTLQVNNPALNNNINSGGNADVNNSGAIAALTLSTGANSSGNVSVNSGNGEMDSPSYNNIFNSIKKESVDNNKMTTAKTFITESNLSSEQVLGLVKLFSFESNRLSFAKWAYHKTIDKKNYIKVYDGLTFSSSKRELAEYIKKNP